MTGLARALRAALDRPVPLVTAGAALLTWDAATGTGTLSWANVTYSSFSYVGPPGNLAPGPVLVLLTPTGPLVLGPLHTP